MTGLLILVLFSIAVTTASNALQRFFRLYITNEKIKFGMAIALILGLALSFAWGRGVLAYFGEINYSDALYPTVFMYVDLIITGVLYALSSKAITDIYDQVVTLKKPPDDELMMPGRVFEEK